METVLLNGFKYQVHVRREYLLLRFSQINYQEIIKKETVIALIDLFHSKDRHLIFLDMLQVDPPSAIDTLYKAGVLAVTFFMPPYRTACLINPADFNGFAALVSQNRGSDVKSESDIKPLLAWLLESIHPDQRQDYLESELKWMTEIMGCQASI